MSYTPLDPHAYGGALNLEDSINAPLGLASPHEVGTRAYRLRSALTCLGSVVTIFVLLNQLGASA